MSSDLLRADVVAKKLAISRPYVYKLEALGLLPSISWPVPSKNGKEQRVIRFHPDDVEKFVEKHRSRPLDGVSDSMAADAEMAGIKRNHRTKNDKE